MLRAVLLVVLFVPLVSAQTATPFVLPVIPTSATEAAGARTATLRPEADPNAMLLNPAFLAGMDGVRATGTLASEWLGVGDIQPGSFAASYGTDLPVGSQSLAMSLGFIREVMDYGEIPLTTGGSDPTSAFTRAVETAYGLGVGAVWSGLPDVSVGLAAYRRQSSSFSFYDEAEEPDRSVTLDLGLYADAPVIRPSDNTGALSVPVSVVGGVVYQNALLASDLPRREGSGIGGSTFQGEPAPRVTVLGGGPRVGLALGTGGTSVSILSLDTRLEREWAEFDGVRFAFDLTLLDAIALRSGALVMDDEDQLVRSGASLGLSVDGVLRSVGALAGDESLRSAGERFVFQASFGFFGFSDRADHSPFLRGTDYISVTLGWRP